MIYKALRDSGPRTVEQSAANISPRIRPPSQDPRSHHPLFFSLDHSDNLDPAVITIFPTVRRAQTRRPDATTAVTLLMPTQDASPRRAAHDLDQPATTSVAYSYPLTPPPDLEELPRIEQEQWQNSTTVRVGDERGDGENTAASMSMMQEVNIYLQHSAHAGSDNPDVEKEKSAHQESMRPTPAAESHGLRSLSQSYSSASPLESHPVAAEDLQRSWLTVDAAHGEMATNMADTEKLPQAAVSGCTLHEFVLPTTINSLPLDIDPHSRSSSAASVTTLDDVTRPWCFSRMRLSTHYPSSLMHPGSKFEGTQQSDRQTYSVSVTFLTVDISQCTLSGYLKIEGLTLDHPTLTTFFRGEIIGGPNQRYSFQTKTRGWGATDKTDLMHWARFSPWRPLSREAKRDLSFDYPIPGSALNGNDAWWQQEHIFMRWKEEFLVPDHRVRSIQGASFEGFYYICFNQIEGKISGIYFHARSEK